MRGIGRPYGNGNRHAISIRRPFVPRHASRVSRAEQGLSARNRAGIFVVLSVRRNAERGSRAFSEETADVQSQTGAILMAVAVGVCLGQFNAATTVAGRPPSPLQGPLAGLPCQPGAHIEKS